MPTIDQVESTQLIKGLYMGNSGAGKTGSLASLVAAGYNLWMYDFDNLLGSLAQQIMKDNLDPKLVHVQTFTDETAAPVMPLLAIGKAFKVPPFVKGVPTAFTRGLKQLTLWKEEGNTQGIDPAKLGKNHVVVIDSLTNLAQAAFRYCQTMNQAGQDPRVDYGHAQAMVMQVINILFSKQFGTNVLVLAHIDYRENDIEIIKGFPRTIGQALKDQVSVYFNCVLMCESRGTGNNVKRVIRTNSTGIVDLKNPVSFKVADELPLETGLATYFEAVTGHSPKT